MPEREAANPSSRALVRPSVAREEIYTRDILDRLQDRDGALSQRSIARELGIALGLANLLLRRMANKGLIRLVHIRPNRVLYFITPTGIAEKARMTVAYVSRNVQSYRETRDRLRSRFAVISREWENPPPDGKGLIFYGANEIAEIGYVCLQDTDLRLVGVVDPAPMVNDRRFFGMPVHRLEDVSGATLDGRPFGRAVIMSLADADTLADDLIGCDVPAGVICQLM